MPRGRINPARWSLDAAIAYLDEAGIDVAIASISTPGVQFGDDAAARDLAHAVNEYLAGLKRDRPDRFGAFAVLPLADVEGSLGHPATPSRSAAFASFRAPLSLTTTSAGALWVGRPLG